MSDFARATQLHQQGKLQEAEKAYRAILAADDKHADAWHMLGVIAHQAGQNEAAIELIEHAIQLAPKAAACYHNLATIHQQLGQYDAAVKTLTPILNAEKNNVALYRLLVQLQQARGDSNSTGLALRCLGNALASQRQFAEAQAVYREALALRPRDVELLNNLAIVCMELKQPAAAVGYYEKGIAAQPKVAELHNNLGNALLEQGLHDRAAAAYRQALAIKPNYPKCSNNLSVMLLNAGRGEEAVEILRAAVALRPDMPELLSNLGVALKSLGRTDEAMQCYRQALTLNAGFVDAHHNLGNLYLDAGQLDKAELAYRQAVHLKPDDADAYQHLALTYKRQGQTHKSREVLEAALQLDPSDTVSALRAATLCPMIFTDQAQIDGQREHLLAAAREFTSRLTKLKRIELLGGHAEAPFNAQFLGGNLRPVREAYADMFAPLFQDGPPPRREGQPRIGFVVTKGHEGVFLKSMRGVLRNLDPELCQLVIIAPAIAVARMERDLAPRVVEIVRLPERGERVLEVVRAAKLDVLYHWEVGTDSMNYFLPMFRLAPVQCTSWGIQQTSGMRQMNYYLSSSLVEPKEAAGHYRERLLLAETLLTYQFRPDALARRASEQSSRAPFGLSDHQHVYTCAQHLGKFHPDFDFHLGEILRADAHGVLVVTQDRYNAGAELLRERWRTTLADVLERIVWLPRLPESEYRSLLIATDVLLDPPHFGGVNSTYDGLSLAKPIVTSPSGFHRGRYTFGCYQKMKFLDCVAHNDNDYVQMAVKLGTDAEYRREISQQIATASEVLWEDRQAVAEHERLFAELIDVARKT